MRFRMRFLFWVRLIAWIWAKGAEWPSIYMYRARIRCSLICFGVRFFSASLGFRAANSLSMIRSSSCFDLVYPILLMSSLSSLDKWDEAVVISDDLLIIISTPNKSLQNTKNKQKTTFNHPSSYINLIVHIIFSANYLIIKVKMIIHI